MARSLPLRARCRDCDWEESASAEALHRVNRHIVEHHVETGHTIESP